MVPLLPILWLLACSAPIADRYHDTRALCSPEPEQACREAIFADLGIEPSEFEDPALFEPVVLGALELLGRDMGRVGKLRPGPYVRQPFIDEILALQAELGGDEVAPLVYNFVADAIRTTAPDSPDAPTVMSFNVLKNQLQLHPDRAATLSPRFAAHALVHEAAHDLYPSHVPCPGGDGVPRCDEGWAGAYGFEVAVSDLLYRACDGDPHCWEYDFGRWSQASFILEE